MLSLILFKLTVQDIVSDIPRDGGAVVVYVLMAAFIGFIWAGSRGRPQDPTSGQRGR